MKMITDKKFAWLIVANAMYILCFTKLSYKMLYAINSISPKAFGVGSRVPTPNALGEIELIAYNIL